MQINIRIILLIGLGFLLVFFLGTPISYSILWGGLISIVIAILGGIYVRKNLNIEVDVDNSVINRGDQVEIIANINGGLPFYYIRVYFNFIGDIEEDYRGDVVVCNYNNCIIKKEILCSRRGIFNIGNINIKIEDILGISSYEYTVEEKKQLIVLPSIKEVELEIKYSNNNIYRNTSIRTNTDDCIEGIREYILGDSLKRINWKVTAKRGQVHVNEYESHKGEEILVILDMNECNIECGDILEEENMITWFLSIISYCHNYNINSCAMINNYIPYSINISNKNAIKELTRYLLKNYSLGIRGLSKFIVKNIEVINKKHFIVFIVHSCNHELVYCLEKYIGKEKRIEIWCINNYVNDLENKNIIIRKQEL